MVLESRREVLVLPYSRPWLGGPDPAAIPGHGRILWAGEPQDSFPEAERPALTAAAPRLAGRYLYAGPLYVHFGHVMCDSIARLHAFDPAVHDRVVLAAMQCRMDSLPGWVFEVLALFGIPPARILLIEHPTILEQLDFAPPGTRIDHPEPPPQWYLDSLPGDRVTEPSPLPARDVYLGRHHLLRNGTVLGEACLAGLLAEAGFAAVQPETLPIAAQVALLRDAERVVFVEGSAVATLELMRASRAHFYMIPRRTDMVRRFHRMISPRARFTPAFDAANLCRLVGPRGRLAPRSPTVLLDPAAAVRSMAALGLLDAGRFDLDAFLAAERQDLRAYDAALPPHREARAQRYAELRPPR